MLLSQWALSKVSRCLSNPIHTISYTYHRRSILTLAIETSCDDTSVAVLEKHDKPLANGSRATLHFHEKVTANNSEYLGIHPLHSLESHQIHLPCLIQRALRRLPQAIDNDPLHTLTLYSSTGVPSIHRKPTFFTVTRGPGMRSSLSTGLDMCKGLSLALSAPFLGVHHMQAHALTPRLVSALASSSHLTQSSPSYTPVFPFLTLLVSGGHTLLLHSHSLTSHEQLATTVDVAIGNFIDKLARLVLPEGILASVSDTNYGRLLEEFAFPSLSSSNPETPTDFDYGYIPPTRRQEELARRITKWGWGLTPPLANTESGSKSRAMEFTFSGLGSTIKRVAATGKSQAGASLFDDNVQEEVMLDRDAHKRYRDFDIEERRCLAREAMRVSFEHLAGRVLLALDNLKGSAFVGGSTQANNPHQRQKQGESSDSTTINDQAQPRINTLVVSGGVAANKYLRHILRTFLSHRGYPNLSFAFPPPSICTDNAAMIAWTGVEMWEAGWESEEGCLPLKKWSLDGGAKDAGGKKVGTGMREERGGVLGVGGWRRRK